MLIKWSCKYRMVIKEDFNPHSAVSLGEASLGRGHQLIISAIYELMEDFIHGFIISVCTAELSVT